MQLFFVSNIADKELVMAGPSRCSVKIIVILKPNVATSYIWNFIWLIDFD